MDKREIGDGFMQKHEEWVDRIIETPGRLLGPRASHSFINDPRHLAITLSRYKFSAKMLKGKHKAIEVGCGDALGAPLVSQEVGELLCIDIDTQLIEGNKERISDLKQIYFENLDITKEVPVGKFDGGYSLDVIEHIPQELEPQFFANICKCLTDDAIFIIGTPNITAEIHASRPGHSPHVNLKDENGLRELFSKYFQNVLIFSMNDEVVHTGFSPMAHFLFAIGIGLKH